MKTLCYALLHPSIYTLYKMPARPPESSDLILQQRKIFAHNFKKARKEAGLTQKQLIVKTGLRQAFISEVERGLTTLSVDNATLLAAAVNQSLGDLLNPSKK